MSTSRNSEPWPVGSKVLKVEVRLDDQRQQVKVIEYLAGQPLLPGWLLALEPSGRQVAADVSVVGLAVSGALTVPMQRRGSGLVVVLDKPDDIRTWGGVGCVLLADELPVPLDQAVAVAASGGMWISPGVVPYLPAAMGDGGASSAVLAVVAPAKDQGLVAAAKLTPIEHETLELLADGRSNQEIADHRGVMISTVKSCVRSLLRKYGCTHRLELLAKLRPGSSA